jgi:hypothetical protein
LCFLPHRQVPRCTSVSYGLNGDSRVGYGAPADQAHRRCLRLGACTTSRPGPPVYSLPGLVRRGTTRRPRSSRGTTRGKPVPLPGSLRAGAYRLSCRASAASRSDLSRTGRGCRGQPVESPGTRCSLALTVNSNVHSFLSKGPPRVGRCRELVGAPAVIRAKKNFGARWIPVAS